MPTPTEPTDDRLLSRREAIRRAAFFLGVALTPSLLAGGLRAQAPAPGERAGLRALTAEQMETVTAAADRILPRTDTPGASDVGVPAYIDLMLSEYMSPDESRVFVAGLAQLDAMSRAAHGSSFARLPPDRQDVVLRALAVASQNQTGTFFHFLREATIVGYFTSETVGKTVLHYDPVPGRFDPCVPIAEVGNVNWTR